MQVTTITPALNTMRLSMFAHLKLSLPSETFEPLSVSDIYLTRVLIEESFYN